MGVVYQGNGIDYPTAEEAIIAVEEKGSGSVVQFHVSPNLPRCLPEMVYSSCALWTYHARADGVKRWMAHSIFDGTGAAYKEERPQ